MLDTVHTTSLNTTEARSVQSVSFSDSRSQHVEKSHGGTDLGKLKLSLPEGNTKISGRNSSH